jgi:hypothetical protein
MNIRIFSMVILLILSTSSCKKFLEPVPNDFLSPDAYYTNLGQLDYARAGVYSILGSLGFYGSYANYLFAFAGDEGYMNRFTLTTGPWNYNFSPAEQFSTAFWTTMYNGINRANVLLANIDKNEEIVKDNRDVIRGEILFLRGYFYFQLVQYYGGVPLKLEPTISINNVDIPRSTVKQVYDQILKDMTAAEQLVDNINAIGNAGRVSKSAVRGFLAKVCLFMAGEPLKETGRYQEAVNWAKMVIDDAQAGHSLNPSFPDIFIRLASDRYDIKESIWEVEFWGNRQDSYIETTNNGHINGPANGPTAPNNNTGRADAYLWSTSKLYNVFEPGDNRKFMSLAFFTYNSTGPNGSKTYRGLPANDLAKWTLTPAKFRREYEVLLPKNGTQTPQNVPLLRFADVLLMYAEALNEVRGPTNDAIAAVNQVRRRGWAKGIKTIQITNGGSGYTSAPAITFTGGGGTIDAVATATLTGDRVTSITLNRDSVSYFRMGRYSSVPAINISGGGGSGATAIATIYSPDEADVTSINTASKDAFKKFLQDERMRELSFESSRKADLLRWGIFLDVMRDMGIKAQQEIPNNPAVKYFTNVLPKHLLLPIPANEKILNKAIEQNNPGWD